MHVRTIFLASTDFLPAPGSMSDRHHVPYRGTHYRGNNRHNFNSNHARRGRSRDRGGGRRGPPRGNHSPGNRFTAQAMENPEDAVWSNLINMLTVVGEQNRENRVANLKLLVDVITGSNADLFLAYDSANMVSAKRHYGPLVIHLFDCVTALPQHTSVYATLAHLIHAKTKKMPHAPQVPFAQRLMAYSVRIFGRDLDTALSSIVATDRLLAERRCHFIVRFWAIWWTNMPGNRIVLDDASSRIVPFAIQKAPLDNFMQFLQTLVTAAQMSRKHHRLFASLAMTGANALEISTEVHEWKQRYVCQPIEELLESLAADAESGEFSNDGTDYAPGTGKNSILLLYEQWESDEMLDDQDEEESRNSSACCDTLQDLLRISKLPHNTNDSSLQLVHDAPWKDFEAEDFNVSDDLDSPIKVLLDLFNHSEMLLNILRNRLSLSDSTNVRVAECPSVVPRLPIFGPPSSKDGQVGDDEDEEDGEAASPRLKAYRGNFTSIDRYFYGQMIRDIVFSNEPYVTDEGVERGSAKTTAEQLWHLSPISLEGLEYCILETFVSLMMTPYVSIPFVGMVILELTKLEPGYFSAAIAIAIHTVVEDYMPILTPQSRSVLASWFAFHLIQTDFQWPIAYWNHWGDDKDIWNSPSRKAFIMETLSRIAANVCSPRIVTEECLPLDSKWSEELIKGALKNDPPKIASLVSDLNDCFAANESSDKIIQTLADRSDLDTIEKVKAIFRGLLRPAVDEYNRRKSTVGEMQSVPNAADPNSIMETLSLIANRCNLYLHSLVGGVASDDDKSEELGAAILEELGEITSWSDALLKTCIVILLDSKLVSAKTVITWQLDHFEDLPYSCWWDSVSFVVHYGLNCAPSTDGTFVQAAEVDSSEKATLFLADLLPFMVSLVIKKIVANERQDTGRQLPHQQVLLVEGLKVVLRRAEKAYVELHSQKVWDQSSFNGPGLARTNETMGSPAVDLLQSCLQCM